MEKITQEELKQIVHYDPETGVMIRLKHRQKSRVGKKMGWLAKTPYSEYIKAKIKGRDYSLASVAWLYVYGEYPANVRHINGNNRDLRLENLREESDEDIARDRRAATKNNKSGYLGVSWYRKTKKWVAHIKVNGKTMLLGYHKSKHVAYQAYLDAKKQYHPESRLAQCQ